MDGRPSTPNLIGEIVRHATTLISAEMQLARLEAGEKLTLALASIVSIVVAGSLAIVAALVLLAGVVLALAQVLPLYLSCFVVGGVMALLALITIVVAARNLSATRLKPRRTIGQIEATSALVKGDA